jgi:hypothetical protein
VDKSGIIVGDGVGAACSTGYHLSVEVEGAVKVEVIKDVVWAEVVVVRVVGTAPTRRGVVPRVARLQSGGKLGQANSNLQRNS